MSERSRLSSASNATSSLKHVAIIMDGNGRWAQKRHLLRTVGHVKGAARVRALVEACIEQGIQTLTLFAFSTENWGAQAKKSPP